MCSYYLDLYSARPYGQASSDAVFPWCAVRSRGSFRQPRSRLTSTAHIKQLDHDPLRIAAGLRVSPGLEAGARWRATRRFLLVVFKTMEFSKTCAVSLRDTRGTFGPLGPFGCFNLEVEDTGIEPVTSSLQSWRSPS